LTQDAAGKVILTLHSQGAAPSAAKNNPAPAVKAVAAKASAPAVTKAAPAAAKVTPAPTKVAAVKEPAKPAAQPSKAQPKQPAKSEPASKVAASTAAAPMVAPMGSAPAAKPAPKVEEKKWAMSGKRDPFFSPVVQTNGSGCSTGKKCLEIGAINLRGVVKSDTGFIAVVTNNLNKAYFLRENDPVFNGYVVKITGDSVVFQETIQDKLGKPFTREVVKRIFTPAV
jgi:hypothetical protein